jgi:hypothetical protein
VFVEPTITVFAFAPVAMLTVVAFPSVEIPNNPVPELPQTLGQELLVFQLMQPITPLMLVLVLV